MGLSIIFSVLIFMHLGSTVHGDQRELYIVYMGDSLKNDRWEATALHSTVLRDIVGKSDLSDILLHSYHKSFNGFVARLHKEEAETLADLDRVVSVFPNGINQLHTTRSWNFLNFPQDVATSTTESDIIIGMFDTGIWPESPNFDDTGYGPPPSKWNGSCVAGFPCNNKIIGAKYYRQVGWYPEGDMISPRDNKGHGTHTASTAAGAAVKGANLYGLGSGTARGGTPRARIAVYKICWKDGCSDADILHAFEDAVADGVDIISFSVGPPEIRNYFINSMAIGAFHAMKNGILTSMSAGNTGPRPASILNFSPWSLSVAATSIDRKFLTTVRLGDNTTYEGISINTFDLREEMHPLIADGAPYIGSNMTSSSTRLCNQISHNASIVKDNILLCNSKLSSGIEANLVVVGATGLLLQADIIPDKADAFLLPASCIGPAEGDKIRNYAYSSSNPTATIFKSHESKDSLAPYVVSFSSRGPNPITPNILKPDIAAPGADILAAWSPISSMIPDTRDERSVSFNIASGTSMACPHVTGAAAYVKSFHPDWSPSAIKSAIMTTAFSMDSIKNSDAEFAYGAGLVNPSRAVDPGLVYDMMPIDYIKLLCGQGYTTDQLRKVAGKDLPTCSEDGYETVWDFNYPSFSLYTSLKYVDQEFRRRLTNVGSSSSIYKATVKVTDGTRLKIQVQPNILSFTAEGQVLAFALRITGMLDRHMISATLVWDDGAHQVRSPIVVYSDLFHAQASCSRSLYILLNNNLILVFSLIVAITLF